MRINPLPLYVTGFFGYLLIPSFISSIYLCSFINLHFFVSHYNFSMVSQLQESDAIEFLEYARWGDTPSCPRCDSSNVCQVKDSSGSGRNSRFLWRCHGCKRQFTVRIGTEFEDSRVSAYVWVNSIFQCENAFQIHKKFGISYKSALYMANRIKRQSAILSRLIVEKAPYYEITIALNKLTLEGVIKKVGLDRYEKVERPIKTKPAVIASRPKKATRTDADNRLREFRRVTNKYMCPGCGVIYTDRPQSCKKCTSHSFEVLRHIRV